MCMCVVDVAAQNNFFRTRSSGFKLGIVTIVVGIGFEILHRILQNNSLFLLQLFG